LIYTINTNFCCNSDKNKGEARSRLQELSNELFEELAADIYDEVDRRETDASEFHHYNIKIHSWASKTVIHYLIAWIHVYICLYQIHLSPSVADNPAAPELSGIPPCQSHTLPSEEPITTEACSPQFLRVHSATGGYTTGCQTQTANQCGNWLVLLASYIIFFQVIIHVIHFNVKSCV